MTCTRGGLSLGFRPPGPFPPRLWHKRHGDGFGGVGVREVQGAPLDVRGGVWLRPHGGAVCAAVAVCAVALDGTAGRGARTHTGAARGPTRGRRKAATDGDRRRREYTQAAYAKDDVKTCSSLLPELKLGLTQFKSLPPFFDASANNATQEAMLAREILEHAVLLSVKLGDEAAFARNFLQLQTYYTDIRDAGLPSSQRELPILGLNLLRLLVQNRTAEFHAELELLGPDAAANSVYIRYPVELEQCLMEGSYAKVLALRREAPSPECAYFLEALAGTVTVELASCVESAYRSLPVADAQAMLSCSAEELDAIIRERGWRKVDGGKALVFPATGDSAIAAQNAADKDAPRLEVISQVLTYARELERIV